MTAGVVAAGVVGAGVVGAGVVGAGVVGAGVVGVGVVSAGIVPQAASAPSNKTVVKIMDKILLILFSFRYRSRTTSIGMSYRTIRESITVPVVKNRADIV